MDLYLQQLCSVESDWEVVNLDVPGHGVNTQHTGAGPSLTCQSVQSYKWSYRRLPKLDVRGNLRASFSSLQYNGARIANIVTELNF
jgi:hypothetical protein